MIISLKGSKTFHRLLPGLIETVRTHAKDARSVQMAFNLFESDPPKKSAQDVVIMHGLFGSKQNWRGIGRALTRKMDTKIYTLDARNHGDSPHTSLHNYHLMAEDLKDFVHTQKLSRPAAIGHSMGGRAIMLAALLYPDLIEKGIIVDISPLEIPRDFSGMESIFRAMNNISIPSDLPMAQGRTLAEEQIKAAVDDEDTVNFILLNLRKRASGEYFWACNVSTLLKSMHNIANYDTDISKLPPYQGPMMFICGKHSNFVDPKSWPAIQKIFPNSEVHWLDAGHLVHFEQPAEFLELVEKFLKS